MYVHPQVWSLRKCTYTATLIDVPNQPKTQHRSVRIPDEDWTEVMAKAKEADTSAGELIRDFLGWWLRRPGAKLPKRLD